MRRDILVDSATAEIRIAVLENEQLAELFIERPTGGGVTGNIYKGRVNTILPGMQSAFVDVGLERDAFLYVEDVAVPSGEEALWDLASENRESVEGGQPETEDGTDGMTPETPRPLPPGRPRIEDLLREGQEVLVQVARDPLPRKGARITCHLSLPGRFLVYLPSLSRAAVSRRIVDPAERDRLKDLVHEVARSVGIEGGGFIVRTAGMGLGAEDFRADAGGLWATWREIRRHATSSSAPMLLHREPGVVARVLRDVFGQDVQTVLVDTDSVHREALEYVRKTHPALVPRVRRWDGKIPLFTAHGLESQIEKALRARVWLRSGGSIVIHPTEALVAIDVNTGKYVGRRHPEETILKTNLEAVAEIVRQVRLRDLGGIIVIDFIDMEAEDSRARVAAALQAELRKDRARSRMLQISEFGLVEITRQRSKPSLERTHCVPCPRCHGSGRVKSAETVYFEVLRALRALAQEPGATVVVRAHPETAEFLKREEEGLRSALPGGRVVVQADPGLEFEKFTLNG